MPPHHYLLLLLACTHFSTSFHVPTHDPHFSNPTTWFDQRFTAPFPSHAPPNGEIRSSRSFGLGIFRRPAEATSVGAAAAARQASDRISAAPTLYEVLGGTLDGRTIDGLPINGKQTRNNTDLSSSSYTSTQHSLRLSTTGAGRLNASVPWIPAQHTPYEYVQVTFPSATLLSHVSTRGGGDYGSWVTSFRVSTSIDGYAWHWYTSTDSNTPHVFPANTDTNTIVRHALFGKFAMQSLFAPAGKAAQLNTKAPLLARMFRIYPVTWNATSIQDAKIALRFDILRRVECGDGVWDEMNEKCEDGNVISGDGCSGTSGNWRGTSGPCEQEVFTTEHYNTKTAPQRYLNGVDSGHTVEQYNVPPHPKRLSQWCHPGSDCYDCASQRVTHPAMKYDAATQESYLDPAYRATANCVGRRSQEKINGEVKPDRPPIPDDGYTYRTTETQARGEILYPNYPRL